VKLQGRQALRRRSRVSLGSLCGSFARGCSVRRPRTRCSCWRR
jgi:hypothetical protein